MKISSLHIKNYKQFLSFKIDLFYPEGHLKAGQPLNKACLIGQSGTGKSNILKLIMESIVAKNTSSSTPILEEDESSCVAYLSIAKPDFNIKLRKHILPDKVVYQDAKVDLLKDEILHKQINNISSTKLTEEYISQDNKESVYFFPALADYESSLNYYEKAVNYTDDFKKSSIKNNINKLDKNKDISYYKYYESFLKKVVYCHPKKLKELIGLLNNYMSTDSQNESTMRLKATYEAEEDENFNFKKFINDWKISNPSITQQIINNNLTKLLYELNINIDFREFGSESSFDYIFKSSFGEKKIPYYHLSSGTRQLIGTLLPLIIRKPKNSVIIVDEPETSLFPDIQRKIISMFTEIGEDNQYFFATHSPIVAASFEPEERFYFYFSEGDVRCSRGISPEGDDPNDLLYYDFGMKTVLGEKGELMYKEYTSLRRALKYSKDEREKEEIANKILEIGNLYGFDKLNSNK